MNDDDYKIGIDLFTTFELGSFSFLGEALLDRREQEIERLQLGLTMGNNKAWLGRYHNPIGYWNTQFHHGSNLETSISRPAVIDFEHDGILPIHLTGLLIEGQIEHDSHGFGYALAVGAGPDLSKELEALDILDPGTGSHDVSFTFNFYFEPMPYAPTRYGLFVNYTVIPAALPGINEIRQINSGLYGHWESLPWNVTGELFYIFNDLERAGPGLDEDFFSGYLQAEYNLHKQWTLFGRIEWTLGEETKSYSGLFPHHVRDRILGGIRLDISEQHALKLEISGNRTLVDDYGQFILQWDAMF